MPGPFRLAALPGRIRNTPWSMIGRSGASGANTCQCNERGQARLPNPELNLQLTSSRRLEGVQSVFHFT